MICIKVIDQYVYLILHQFLYVHLFLFKQSIQEIAYELKDNDKNLM